MYSLSVQLTLPILLCIYVQNTLWGYEHLFPVFWRFIGTTTNTINFCFIQHWPYSWRSSGNVIQWELLLCQIRKQQHRMLLCILESENSINERHSTISSTAALWVVCCVPVPPSEWSRMAERHAASGKPGLSVRLPARRILRAEQRCSN